MFDREIKLLKYEWNHYKTVLIILTTFLTIELYLTGLLQLFFDNLGNFGLLGAFLAGFFYTFGVTSPFSFAALFILVKDLNIWLLIILGSLGGTMSEYVIYDIAKEESKKTIRIKGKRIRFQIKSKLLRKLSLLIAGIIIATPIPDEFASILFGIERYKLRDFLIFTFVCKVIGIILIVGLRTFL